MPECLHPRFEYTERFRQQACVKCGLLYDVWLEERIRLLEASAYRIRQAPRPYDPRTELKGTPKSG